MTLHVGALHQLAVVVLLTFREAQRRKLLWLGLGMGIIFVALFSAGFYFAYRDFQRTAGAGIYAAMEALVFGSTFLSAALYVVNFLIVMVSVLTAVGSISGEIETETIHAIAAKPIRRWQLVLGKWIGQALLIVLYSALLAVGVMLSVYLISGYRPQHAVGVLLILILEGLTALSLTVLGSTMLSTLATGVTVFTLYGLAFVGGWVEQLGMFLESRAAVDLGIASSLLMPSEGLWRYAIGLMLSGASFNTGFGFMVASQPTPAFVVYAVIYTLLLLGLAMWAFGRRDL